VDSRERVRLALSGGRPDRVPCALGFFRQDLFGEGDADELFDTDVRFVEFEPPPMQESFLSYLETLPDDVHVGNLGQLRTYHEWSYRPEIESAHPLSHVNSSDDLVDGLLPDLTDPARHAGISDNVRRLHARGLAVAAAPPHLGGELFEVAYRLRGFSRFMDDLLTRDTLVDYLLDQIGALLLSNSLVLARAGADVLLLDDDVASARGLMISPLMWQRFFKPRLAEVIRAVRETAPDMLIFYHSDGDFTRIVPELVEIGVQVINPLQPDCMDAAALREAYGDTVAFWGTVGTARLWDEGTPDQVRGEVESRIATLGGASLLLSPAYDIDFAPRANVAAFVEAVRARDKG
jgi:uroporphyrinogen decarboxylase